MSKSNALAKQLSERYGIELSAAEIDENGLYNVTVSGKNETILDSQFECDEKIARVTIEEGVGRIGTAAFEGCRNLQSVTIPKSVTIIDAYAFEDCGNLTDIYYQGGLEDWLEVSLSCDNGSPMCSAKNLYIDGELLQGELVIPEGTETIENCAFLGCTALTSVKIADSVTSVGEEAFKGCTGLTSVTIGSGMEDFGFDAFDECDNLTDVYYRGDLKGWMKIEFYGIYSSPMCCAKNLYIGGELLQGEVVIPEGTERICNWVFVGCGEVTKVTIPDSVTSVEQNAFAKCDRAIEKEDGVGYVGGWAIKWDYTVVDLKLRDGTRGIAECAFRDCRMMKSVTLPKGLLFIGSGAFYGCDNLTDIYYSGDLKGWLEMKIALSFPNPRRCAKNLYIDGQLLQGELVIPQGTEEIGDCAFTGCTGLTSVKIPDGVTSIGGWAFAGCTGLTSITLPDSVTSISYRAFAKCTGLTSVKIPDSVTSVGGGAFGKCTGLTSVKIPDSVTSVGAGAFGKCDGVIEVEDGVSYVDGWAIDCDEKATCVQLRPGTRGIADKAFIYCEKLKSITLPDGVKHIGFFAFCLCSALESVTMGAGVSSIDQYAFMSCGKLTAINFQGTTAQWRAIKKEDDWDDDTGDYTVYCTDGTIDKYDA